MSATNHYADVWRLHRRRTIVFFGVVCAMLPGIPVSLYLLASAGIKNAGPWVIAPWVVVLYVSVRRLEKTPCPRCGKAFYRPFLANLSESRCAHCRLPMNAVEPVGGAQR